MEDALDRFGTSLSALTLLGVGLALVDRFAWPLSPPLAEIGLWLAFLAGGLPAAVMAIKELWSERKLDIDLLMVVAALAAAEVGAPLEGAVLLALFSLSSTLEHRALGKARRAIEALMALRPDSAIRRRPDGGTEEVPIADLRPGDVLILRPGARVPVDSILLEGEGSLDESSITGESVPVHKAPGARLHEATVNLNAILAITVERPVSESTVARMIQMVTAAQAMKAPSERFSDWFGQRYTVVVLLGSVLSFLFFVRMGREIDDALYRAATLLVAASPCAVVISVPAAILSALSAAARGGVLFKGGGALETLARVESFAFDKTGTLTTGKAEVTRVIPLDGREEDLVAGIAGVEAHSEHPIAEAIRRHAQQLGLQPIALRSVTSSASEGIYGEGETGLVWAGNPRMVDRMGAALDHPALRGLQDGAETVVYFGHGARLIGALTVADRPRETSRSGIAALRAAGIGRLVMMTGDRRPVAERIGGELGFAPADISADLLPGDKVLLVDELARKGPVAFVGDGVNDAAALSRADVGIAMGAAGSEVALQAAEVALLSENMDRLAAAYRLSRRTARIIRQNLGFALTAMVVLVVSGLFYELPLPLAVLGHEGGTVLVVLNGLRLLFDPIRADSTR